jgi:hypothetical protein
MKTFCGLRLRDEGRCSCKSGVLRGSRIQSTRELCMELFAWRRRSAELIARIGPSCHLIRWVRFRSRRTCGRLAALGRPKGGGATGARCRVPMGMTTSGFAPWPGRKPASDQDAGVKRNSWLVRRSHCNVKWSTWKIRSVEQTHWRSNRPSLGHKRAYAEGSGRPERSAKAPNRTLFPPKVSMEGFFAQHGTGSGAHGC